MKGERSERVGALLEEALSKEPASRTSFLIDACAGDETLLREVSSLLRCHERAGSFLETPYDLARGLEIALGWNAATFTPGALVSSRFEIVGLRAHGGMGEVYEAFDRELSEKVALKTIRPELALDPNTIVRFQREVAIARKVSHPNVCRVHDLFHERNGSREFVFLTMELLSGESLAMRLGRAGRLGWKEALPILMQIASGLEAAHAAGIVHRDLKAENVMLVPEGDRVRAVVSDFGLAALGDTDANLLSAPGRQSSSTAARRSSRSGWGTPAYMSPEQLRGEPASEKSDVFALGIIAYEALTGVHPYPFSEAPLASRFQSKPRALRDFDPSIPSRFQHLVRECLSIEPGGRPDGARTVREQLEAIPTKIPARRIALLATASAAAAVGLSWKAGAPLFDLLEELAIGPRVLPLEDYVDSAEALQALREGIARVREGANLEGIPYFEQAIAEDPDSILAHAALVDGLLNVGEQKKAQSVITQITALAEGKALDATERHFAQAARFREDENCHAAADEERALVDRYPDDIDLKLRYARRLEQCGRIVEAAPIYEKISERSFAAVLGLARAQSIVNMPAHVIDLLEQGLSRARSLSLEAQGMLHSILGFAYYDLSRFETAQRHFEQSLDLRTRARDRRGTAASMTNLAKVYAHLGRFTESMSTLERALQLSREMGDIEYESYTLGAIGWVRLQSGDARRAIEFLRQAFAMEWAREDHYMVSSRLNTMAYAHSLLGQFGEAQVCLAQAEHHLALSEARDQRAFNHYVNGLMYAARGEFAKSDSALRDALVLYQGIGSRHDTADVRACLAETHMARGDFHRARGLVLSAVESLNRVEDELRLARTEVCEAELLMNQGVFREGERALVRSERRLKGASYWDTALLTLIVRGELSLALAEFDAAIHSVTEALRRAESAGFKALEVRARIRFGEALMGVGNYDSALSSLETALDIASRLGWRPLLSMGQVALARLHLKSRNIAAALRTVSDAIAIAEALGLEPLLPHAYAVMGEAFSAQGKEDQAAAAYERATSSHSRLCANVPPVYREAFRRHADVSKVLQHVQRRGD